MNGQKDKFIYEAFHEYLDACARIAKVKWDSVASEDLIRSGGARWEYFVRAFQSSEAFVLLCKKLEERDPSRPDPDDVPSYYSEYYDYSFRPRCCLETFFNNTGTYDEIIAGRKIDAVKLFSHFVDLLEEKEIEIFRYVELRPLIIELRKGEAVEVGGFRFSDKVIKHGKKDETNFIFVSKTGFFKQSLGYIQDLSTKSPPFQDILLILNLYFEKPVFISEHHWHVSGLLSKECGWHREWLRWSDDLWEALRDEYDSEAREQAIVDSADCSYYDWDLYGNFINSKEAEFVRSGKAPINIVEPEEIEKLKQFITKTASFLESAVYKESDYLQIALNHYVMAHDDAKTGAVEGVIALEALFFSREQGELKDRLANRMGCLLGKSQEEKSRIKTLMEKLYTDRCKYVHGKDTSKGRFDPKLRNLLRLSLLTFFGLAPYCNSNKKRGELLDNLDSVFNASLTETIRIQAADFLSLARSCQF